MKKTIVRGIIILIIASILDSVLTNLGLSKKISTFQDFYPETATQYVFTAILTITYLYGLYVLIGGIANLVKRKRK